MTATVAAGELFLLLLNGQRGVIDQVLGFVGIHGPSWTTDNAWIKPGLALTMLWGLGATIASYLATNHSWVVEMPHPPVRKHVWSLLGLARQ